MAIMFLLIGPIFKCERWFSQKTNTNFAQKEFRSARICGRREATPLRVAGQSCHKSEHGKTNLTDTC